MIVGHRSNPKSVVSSLTVCKTVWTTASTSKSLCNLALLRWSVCPADGSGQQMDLLGGKHAQARDCRCKLCFMICLPWGQAHDLNVFPPVHPTCWDKLPPLFLEGGREAKAPTNLKGSKPFSTRNEALSMCKLKQVHVSLVYSCLLLYCSASLCAYCKPLRAGTFTLCKSPCT